MNNFKQIINSKCRSLPIQEITFLECGPESLADRLAQVTKGVLVVYATWSGCAAVSFGGFCDAIAKIGKDNFTIYVVDNDQYDVRTFQNVLGELPQGKGECYWIRDGRIIHRDHGYLDEPGIVKLAARIQEFIN